MKGKLYLIPSPLGETAVEKVIPQGTLEVIRSLNSFMLEELRSGRRYLSECGFKGSVSTLNLYTLNEHTSIDEMESYIKILKSGVDMGMISEAGLPAVADPGSQLVLMAHRAEIEVIPLVGPSSLMLALMASGRNGQLFSFVGYLPIKREQRKAKIEEIVRDSKRDGSSKIIIETPYRNDSLMADFLQFCPKETLLTVASSLTTPDGFVYTKSVEEWRKSKLTLNKKPTVFII